MLVKRGDIFNADLGYDRNAGSEQQGERPVVIIQNDIGNAFSPNGNCSSDNLSNQ